MNEISENDVFAPGDVVDGRYRVVGLRGKGGTGEVYEAVSIEYDERVAIKTLLPRFFDSSTVVTRFERECEYSQRIDHPNVLAIQEVFKIPLPETIKGKADWRDFRSFQLPNGVR